MTAALPRSALTHAGADTLNLRVQSVRYEAESIHAFELVDPNGGRLPEVTAGSHLDVHLGSGLMRSYSLAGDPLDQSRWTLGVLREVKGQGGSKAMHDQVKVGQILTVGLPRNAFPLAANATHSVLLAGGIGITPLKAMAHTLAAQDASFELHYCAKTPEHAAFKGALRALVPPDQLHFHHDQGDPAKGLDIAALLKQPAPGTHVYFCGPPGFMKACTEATAHWSTGTVHSEHFKAPEPKVSDLPAGSFQVSLARTGITVQVGPEQTIVRAIELAGHRVPTSCLSGLCGACKTGYLEGDVEHNDYILSDEEKTHCMTVCVSRSRGPLLVLDI
ncbi:PDR/VanB family oxidoreductase [Hydrogenophaga sp.]|uniref:PDR/VanB family oxidoreductase n=1 Tax=Hydrogenophaga sp. TaxID=1904254 RepID=UPI0027280400|nr:PDR/VanB family oxidoreductase [Hydrogenophaga sp.]MDO8905780.1 PDR/VanB family oxidoreductase [Hydrogenophaga sp.]